MFRTYDAAVQFLYDNLPMFQRIGAAALKHDLSNTLKLCAVLGDPQKKFKSVHIAGTNGKGSSSHMLASVFQESGYKTGLYTSPHLKQFTERIRVDGNEISQPFVIDFVNRIKDAIDSIRPSFFEITVAMAFDYFVGNNVDIAIIETGLGGRLDSTNVVSPELSLITNIGWDHKDILGDTLEKIASEKAGIIKPGVPVVVSERQEGLDRIFENTAAMNSSTVVFASDNYTAVGRTEHGIAELDIVRNGEPVISALRLPLQGVYQRKNVAGVLQSVDIMKDLNWRIPDKSLRAGLEKVVINTGLRGRWQILGTDPLKVCDTGHNVDGIRQVVEQIRLQQFRRLHFVLGMVKDKDISAILKLLPREASYYFCQAKIPRALDAHLLEEECRKNGLNGIVVSDVNDAIHMAERQASREDMIFIGGSTFVVAEIENL